jgi:hypothetical protein
MHQNSGADGVLAVLISFWLSDTYLLNMVSVLELPIK